VGTGGWAYFKVGNQPSLKEYSQIFDFVEVNYTFYEYPDHRLVEGWRRLVPADFSFSVRCHQDLTHKIGLKPTDQAFEVFYKMKAYCEMLEAPFLVLETPQSQALNKSAIREAEEFLSAIPLDDLKVVWEYRAPLTTEVTQLMDDFGIIQCVDLSYDLPIVNQDVVYSRLFGKGRHNIYQFTDDELVEIENNAQHNQPKTVVLSYHGLRMNTDAIRSQQHLLNGKFLPATNSVGFDSVKSVLAEDAHFPSSKSQLIADQGWKVIDLTPDKRIHLSTVLEAIPEKTYRSLDEVGNELKAVI